MDSVFELLCGGEWEDITILLSLSEEDAINESKNYPNTRVEIFSKNNELVDVSTPLRLARCIHFVLIILPLRLSYAFTTLCLRSCFAEGIAHKLRHCISIT